MLNKDTNYYELKQAFADLEKHESDLTKTSIKLQEIQKVLDAQLEHILQSYGNVTVNNALSDAPHRFTFTSDIANFDYQLAKKQTLENQFSRLQDLIRYAEKRIENCLAKHVYGIDEEKIRKASIIPPVSIQPSNELHESDHSPFVEIIDSEHDMLCDCGHTVGIHFPECQMSDCPCKSFAKA